MRKATPMRLTKEVPTGVIAARPLANSSPDDNASAMQMLDTNGVPCILAPGRTVRALAALGEFARKKRAYDERPPAAVVGLLPARSFRRAFSTTSFSGIASSCLLPP